MDTLEKLDVDSGIEDVEILAITPKIYINSFPKSGTHLMMLLVSHIAQRQEPKVWVGSFRDNSWSMRWQNSKAVARIIRKQESGTYMIGHLGYKPIFQQAMRDAGTLMFFVYRDLRDVVVSQTYHIESEDHERCKHPGRDVYEGMTHEEVMLAVIEGRDKYAGVFDRWELYAPWLDVMGVIPIRYENLILKTPETASFIMNEVIRRSIRCVDFIPIMLGINYDRAIEFAVELKGKTEYSASYRKGDVGDWKQEFTPRVKECFKQNDRGWLRRLKYEQTEDW